MSDEWQGTSRDEYLAERLHSDMEEAEWRATRERDAAQRPTRAEMVAHFAAERAEVEREALEGHAERAVVRDGWRTYPDEIPDVHKVAARIPMSAQLAAELGLPWEPRTPPTMLTVHATLRLTGCGDPTREELAAQLAGIGFDTIDIEEIS